ncbi:MAG: DUF927 domain-containing protein [Sphaerotilus natans subsp. sulfidivorans]|uniref:DUF927 domain-containing protein n=1 Tax=Sphaerotilus sulfidivorans TaxID=639200 RepID=UPI002354BA18|nr:DUF927 domain-containing protein [Sphaerotilus sulfidivorans]MCK6401627.1 DUF927 domain-containing protein [Sphaerotilus sulfidivorans]
MSAHYREVTLDLVELALSFIPPDIGHDERVRVAFAVFDGLGASGGDAWKAWAGRRQSPSEAEDAATWRSACKPGGKVKVSTLFHIAKQHGFRFPRAERDGQPQRAGRPAPSPDEIAAQRAERERLEAEEAAALLAEHEEAARRCAELWEKASETPAAEGVPYLQRKGVQGLGLRYLRDGTALVPMRDAAGKLWSLQRLLPADLVDKESGEVIGCKLYGPPPRKGGRDKVRSRKTGLFHLVGLQADADPLAVSLVLVCEGYATGASLHQAHGHPVAVAFDGGNLRHVAAALRERFPAARLLVCGDDDKPTEARGKGNPGRKAAAAAARAARAAGALARVVFPEGLPDGGSDFNDLHQSAGLAAVVDQVGAAVAELLQADAAELADTPDDAPADASPPWSDDPAPNSDDQRPEPPPEDEAASSASRPAKTRGKAGKGSGKGRSGSGDGDSASSATDDGFRLDDRGVWYLPKDAEGNPKKPIWLSSPLQVTAISRATDGNGWGLLAEFTDRDNRPKAWAIPAAALASDGAEWFARLRDMGLRTSVTRGARSLLAQYIDTRNPPERITSTDRTGWHDGRVFVTPSASIAATGAGRQFVFQSESSVEDTLSTAGDFDTWRDAVALRCVGNSRLSFVLSCAFAAPLAHVLGVPTGGFHLQGDSSLGKTTALLVAASVWGSHKYKRQWRQTDNALESVAAQHCDLLLILDEIGQADGRIVGECVYMLGNEMEKGRATRGGMARRVRTWRLLFLSSGEKSLSDYMREAGRKVNEGQEVRMPSIVADAGAGLGMLEALHDLPSGRDFSDTLQRVTASHHGHAGRRWLQHLADRMDSLEGEAGELVGQFEAQAVPQYAHPQVWRVARRFALAAAAGELATRAGLTGWPEGEAMAGARRCFEAWLSMRGHTGSGEKVAALLQVRAFLEKNGDALFTWWHRATDDHRPNTALRVGFKRWVNADGEPVKRTTADDYCDARAPDGGRSMDDDSLSLEYLVLPEQFRGEVCKGLRPDFVAQVLKDAGCLNHEKGRLTRNHRLPGMGSTKVFHILPTIFSVDVEGLEA